LLHLPSAAESSLLVPLEREPARLAFGRIRPLAPWKRAIAEAALALGGARAMAAPGRDIGLLAGRAGAAPLLEWLPAPSSGKGSNRIAIVSRSTGTDGARLVLHPFADGTLAPYVAKLRPPGGGGAETERARLDRIGTSARLTGILVPSVVGAVEAGGREFVLESRVSGKILAPLLKRGGARLEDVLDRICTWLEEWARATATTEAIERERLEREVLAPARTVVPEIARGNAYLAWLEERCGAVAGRRQMLTASHNDLSAWNVLLDGARIGVIDWETAEASSLPLKDFYYFAADAVLSARGHALRVDAVRACFESGGPSAALAGELRRRLVDALGIPDDVAEISFHACWLQHAANEARKHPGAGATPFFDVIRWLAAQPPLD
jgi:hypothetical protein